MRVFTHYLYEYRKGLRNLVLYTGRIEERETIEKKLRKDNISYYVQELGGTRMNCFLGDKACIDIIKQMKFRSLAGLTDEQDFMLGVMLGYDRLKQCERYLRRRQHKLERAARTICLRMDVRGM